MKSFESGAQHETALHPELQELFTLAENGLYVFDPVADAEAHGPGSRFLDRVSSLHDPYPLNPEARTGLQSTNNELARKLMAANPGNLSLQERAVFDTLHHDVKDRTCLLQCSTAYRRPIDHTPASVPWALHNDASGKGRIHFETPDDLGCFYSQMRGFPAWATEALRSMHKAIGEGETQPQVIMWQVQRQLKAMLADENAAEASFLKPLDLVPGSASWHEPYREAVAQSVIPAYKEILRFTNEHMPRFRDDKHMGLCHIPTGDAQYQNLLRYYTSYEHVDIGALRYSAEQRFKEVAWQLNEIKQKNPVTRALTFNGFLRYASLGGQPAFQSVQEIEQQYRQWDSRMLANMEAVFGQMPGVSFDIQVNNSLSAEMAYPSYTKPEVNRKTRQGIFTAPVFRPQAYDRSNMLRLLFHEGRPGHQQHLARQQELEHLPGYFRFRSHSHAFMEGWAKYAETLAADFGIEESTWEYVARLHAGLHELRMILLDIGVNWEGWDLRKAQAAQHELLGSKPKEILRVVGWPGQYVVYQLGLDTFTRVRRQTEERLGSRFNVRRLHDAMLSNGGMPLTIFERYMTDWASAEAA